MPSCSWLLAPRSQVVPNEPDSKTCAFLRGRPVRTYLVQRRFRWARGWADFIAKKAQLLGGSMARCRFRYYSYNHQTAPPNHARVPFHVRHLVKFVGVAGAGSESGLPPSFSTAARGVRARAPEEFGGAAWTHKSSTQFYNNNSMRLVLYSRPSSQTLTVLLMLFNRNRSANSIAVHGVVFVSNP